MANYLPNTIFSLLPEAHGAFENKIHRVWLGLLRENRLTRLKRKYFYFGEYF
jgi:hypothetical protein